MFGLPGDKNLHHSFSHQQVCPDGKRLALEQRYINLFTEDSRFNRQLVSFQANKQSMLHSWIKYREGFSAQLVHTLLHDFQVQPSDWVLDPFAGSATTLLVAKMQGVNAEGIELLPNCHLAWEAKSRFLQYQLDELRFVISQMDAAQPADIGEPFPHLAITESAFSSATERDLMYYSRFAQDLPISEDMKILLRLVIASILEEVSFTRKDGQYLRWDYRARKASARNEIRVERGQKPAKKIDKGPLPTVKEALLRSLNEILADLIASQGITLPAHSEQRLIHGSTLEVLPTLPDQQYTAVITSPPYANRYDYTRTYALELAYLGVGEDIFALRQRLLSCTVESRSKAIWLRSHYERIGALDRYERFMQIILTNPAYVEINQALKTRWERGDMNNKGVLPMIEQYLMELTFIFGELFRVCRSGASIAFVNDNVRYGGEIIPIDTLTTSLAESLGFTPLKIIVLAQKKGNSSQQMGRFGREELRKCITIWHKP